MVKTVYIIGKEQLSNKNPQLIYVCTRTLKGNDFNDLEIRITIITVPLLSNFLTA